MTEMNEPSDQLPEELEVVFRQLRHRYGSTASPAAGPELVSCFEATPAVGGHVDELPPTTATLDGVGLEVQAQASWSSVARGRHQGTKLLTATTALIGTTVGKLILGATVTVAGVGAGHAAGVIDVPGLPKPNPAVQIETVDRVGDDGEGGAGHGGPLGDVDVDADERPGAIDRGDDANPTGAGDGDEEPAGRVGDDGDESPGGGTERDDDPVDPVAEDRDGPVGPDGDDDDQDGDGGDDEIPVEPGNPTNPAGDDGGDDDGDDVGDDDDDDDDDDGGGDDDG